MEVIEKTAENLKEQRSVSNKSCGNMGIVRIVSCCIIVFCIIAIKKNSGQTYNILRDWFLRNSNLEIIEQDSLNNQVSSIVSGIAGSLKICTLDILRSVTS